MLYALTEELMNGTVTMTVKTTLIEADSWEKAFEKLTKFENWNLAEGIVHDNDGVSYAIGRECWGRLSKEPMKVV